MSIDENTPEFHVDQELDLRGEICPYTFIKSRLVLEQMKNGQVLRVIVDYYPAIRNIQRSMKEMGYSILGTTGLTDLDTAIFIKKTE